MKEQSPPVTPQIKFEKNQIDMLLGLLGKLYQLAAMTKDSVLAGAWVHLGQIIQKEKHPYVKGELELLSQATESALAAGENAIKIITSDPNFDITAKVRAEVVKKTYLTIKEKIDNAKQQLVQQPISND